MNYIKVVMLICVVPLVMSGCAALKEKTSDTGRKVVQESVTVKPSGSYEECVELHPGLVFDYQFDASDIVDFNVHYHAVTGLHYPVNNKGVTFGKGTVDPVKHDFYTEEQDYYCLMWDNLNDGPVKISYRVVLREK